MHPVSQHIEEYNLYVPCGNFSFSLPMEVRKTFYFHRTLSEATLSAPRGSLGRKTHTQRMPVTQFQQL